jgi:hypothetical protein
VEEVLEDLGPDMQLEHPVGLRQLASLGCPSHPSG